MSTIEEAVPVDLVAVDVQPGEGGDRGDRLLTVTAETGQEDRVGGVRLLRADGEHAVRAQLQAPDHPRLFQSSYAVQETDRLPGVPDPVLGVAQQSRTGEATGHVGDDRDQGFVQGQALHGPAEVREHGVDER